MTIELKALDSEHFPAFASLLGGSEFGGCFCAVWTSHDDTWAQRCNDPARPNLELTKRLVAAGKHVGFLAYDQGELVGWTGSGPKASFPFLARKLASRRTPATETTWSVGCLAVAEPARGNGTSSKMIAAIGALAQASGATALEAYPTRPWDEPRSFRGRWTTFERLGFQVVDSERDGESEVLLMRLELGYPRIAPMPGDQGN